MPIDGTIPPNNAVVLKEGRLDLSSGPARIEIAGDQPEMIYVAIEPYADLAPGAPSQVPPARFRTAAGGAPVRLREGIPGAITASMLSAQPLPPQSLALRMRARPTSMYSWVRPTDPAGQDPDQPRPDSGGDRRARCRDEHLQPGCAWFQGAWLPGQARRRGQVSALI